MKKVSILILILALAVVTLALSSCDGSIGDNGTSGIAESSEKKPEDSSTTKEDESSGTTESTEHVHSFGEWMTAKEATCTEAGTREATCACGEKKTETIPATGHNFINKVCDKCGIKLSEGLKYYLCSDGQSYTVGGIGTCTDTDIVIPSTYEGKPVTSIGDRAFYTCAGLISITLPNSVTNIDNYAFSCCFGLTSITIPDSVTSIGYEAFSGCTGLTSVTIGNSVTNINMGVFGGCTSLTSVTIPDSVTNIGIKAFYGCTVLTSIMIPDSVMNISSNVFDNTAYYKNESNWVDGVLYIGNHLIKAKDSISGSYTIKAGTKCIADDAFLNCKGLTSITIPNSVTSIIDRMFLNCTGLVSITIPNSVTSIGENAFSDTAYYKNKSNWVDGVLYIGNYLIKAKDSISGSYTIKAGTKCMADFAFSDCKGLTSITIPNSMTSIGHYAFNGCSGLKAVYITDIAKWCNISFDNLANPLSYAHNLYLNGKLVTDLVIPNSVTSIGDSAFEDCTGLNSITIPNSVTSIGDFAFCSCKGLTSVTIGNSVTSIGNDAFRGCTGLTSINFNGTKAQWNAISKGSWWNSYTGSYTVHCTDGDISK